MSEPLPLPESDCERAHGLLAEFVDGDLAVAESAWLAGHLERCPECRTALAVFTEIDGELTGWGQYLDSKNPPPASEREQLAAKLESRSARRRAIRWMPAAAAAIAAATLIALVINIATPRRKPAAANPGPSSFIAVPYLPPLDPRENATIVRTNIRVAALIAAGYRIAADPEEIIPADVLVGEDGRAHAVRVLAGIDRLE